MTPEQKLQKENDKLRGLQVQHDNEKKRLTRELSATQKELERTSKSLNTLNTIKEQSTFLPKLVVPKPRAKKDEPWHVTVGVVSSDWQLGEVVNPANLHGCNAYDMAIATMRVQQWVEDSIKMIRHQTQGSIVDKVVIMWLGDEISGRIHIELQETNDGTDLQAILMALNLKRYAMDRFVEEFGAVDTVQVPSNHCRTSIKTPNKQEAQNDYGWFTGKLLQAEYAHDERFNIYISDAYDYQIRIYDYVVSMEHGHKGTGGGGGIQGIGPGMTRATMKRQKRDNALGRPADLYVYGHFHTPISEGDYVVNGSVVGLSEYPYAGSMDLKFGGKPVQWLLYFTPELGYTHSYPIVCLADGEKKLWKTAGRNPWSVEGGIQ